MIDKSNMITERNDKNKTLKRIEIVLVISFCLLLFIPSIIQIIRVEEKHSSQENRNLGKFPEINGKMFISGEFQRFFDKYVEDHHPLRTKLIDLYAKTSYSILHKKLINGVYVGKNDFFFSSQRIKGRPITDEKLIINNFSSFFKELSQQDFEFRFLITYSKNVIYQEYLPNYIVNVDYKSLLEKIKDLNKFYDKEIVLDSYDVLSENKGKQLYYKGDTHWNMRGAYEAYKLLMNSLDTKYSELNELQPLNSKKDFKVNPYKTGFMEFLKEPEVFTRIDEYKRIQASDWSDLYYRYDVNYNVKRTNKKIADNVDFSYIVNENATTDKKLLLFHDSYSQLYQILLCQNYKEIISVRNVNRNKFDYEYIYSFIDQYKPDDVVMEMLDYFIPTFVSANSWNAFSKTERQYDYTTYNPLSYHIDNFKMDYERKSLLIRGWAVAQDIDSERYDTKVVLYNDKNQYEVNVLPNENGTSITNYFEKKYGKRINYDKSRFNYNLICKDVSSGVYKVGILIEVDGKFYFIDTKKKISINEGSENIFTKVKKEYDFSKYKGIKYHIDSFKKNNDQKILAIRGWGVVEGIDSSLYNTKIVLFNDKNQYEVKVLPNEDGSRVTQHFTKNFGDSTNYDKSRFKYNLNFKDISPGLYNVGILIDIDGKLYFTDTGKRFQAN